MTGMQDTTVGVSSMHAQQTSDTHQRDKKRLLDHQYYTTKFVAKGKGPGPYPPLCAYHLQHNTRPIEKVLYAHFLSYKKRNILTPRPFLAPVFDSLQHARTTSNQKLEPGKPWE